MNPFMLKLMLMQLLKLEFEERMVVGCKELNLLRRELDSAMIRNRRIYSYCLCVRVSAKDLGFVKSGRFHGGLPRQLPRPLLIKFVFAISAVNCNVES